MFTISRTRLLAGAATLALTASLGATPGLAATDTATMNVSAQVNQSCTVTSSGDLLFGDISPGAEASADTQFNVNCDFTGEVTIDVGDGENHDGTNRAMANGGGFLRYQLWQSSAQSTQWSDPVVRTVDPGDNFYDVHGVIPSSFSTGAAIGSYTDLVTITVTFP